MLSVVSGLKTCSQLVRTLLVNSTVNRGEAKSAIQAGNLGLAWRAKLVNTEAAGSHAKAQRRKGAKERDLTTKVTTGTKKTFSKWFRPSILFVRFVVFVAQMAFPFAS